MRISLDQARHFLMARHGLGDDIRWHGRSGILEWIRDAGCIQFDPIDICGRNADLVLQARIGGFRKGDLEALLYTERALLDGWDKNMSIYPAEDWPHFARKRNGALEAVRSREAVDAVRRHVLDEIERRGPLCSSDFDLNEKVEWYWAETQLSRAALERFYHQGALLVHHKVGTRKYYDLAERILPEGILSRSDPNPDKDAYLQWHLARRIRSVGLMWNRGSDAWLGIDGLDAAGRNRTFAGLEERGEILRVDVDGIPEPLYLHRDHAPLLDSVLETERLVFLAPLDNLMWDRNLIEALFGFQYRWEIYTPKDKRRYGYYVLPMVRRGRFVGRAEPVREQGKIVLRDVWWEQGERGHLRALNRTLGRFNTMMGE